MYQPNRGLCRTLPLTATVRELAGPLPERLTHQLTCCVRPHRPRLTAADVISAVAKDAIRAAAKASATLISVGPAEPGDPTLLFLRKHGQTQVMIGVPPSVIRSTRLRGSDRTRDRATERQWEYLRVAEQQARYELEDSADDHDLTDGRKL